MFAFIKKMPDFTNIKMERVEAEKIINALGWDGMGWVQVYNIKREKAFS